MGVASDVSWHVVVTVIGHSLRYHQDYLLWRGAGIWLALPCPTHEQQDGVLVIELCSGGPGFSEQDYGSRMTVCWNREFGQNCNAVGPSRMMLLESTPCPLDRSRFVGILLRTAGL